MTVGRDCERRGLPGDGTTFSPPNEWDAQLLALSRKPRLDFFSEPPAAPVLPPPPGGEAVRHELRYLHTLKGLRAGMADAIGREDGHFSQAFYGLLGVTDPQGLQALPTLVTQVSQTAKHWGVRFKARFNRPRPVQLDAALAPPFCPGHPAYPSGHATQALAVALALVDATPGSAALHDTLVATARQVAFRREVAGVHYPSDTECGFQLAAQILDHLRGDAGYRQAVDAARAELQKS